MIYFIKHIKGIAYFLAMLLLLQSCMVYNKASSTVEEACSEKNAPVKIKTKNGEKYKLKWIDEKDGNIVSIRKVKKKYFDRNEIFQFAILDPEPHTVPLDVALKHQGEIRFLTIDNKDRYVSHQFIKISKRDDIITGYKMTGKDTLSVIIPVDQIEKIRMKDKASSAVLTTVGLTCGVGLIVLIIVAINDFSGYDWWS